MTVTVIRTRVRTRNADRARLLAELTRVDAALADPALIGWDAELRESRDRILAELDAPAAAA